MYKFKVTNVAYNSNENSMNPSSDNQDVTYTTNITLKQVDTISDGVTLNTGMGNFNLTYDGINKDIIMGDIFEISVTKKLLNKEIK